MTQAISKELRIICLRSGIEISIEKDRADALLSLMEQRKFLLIDGRLINTADIVGIFTPADIEDSNRRKNGQWQDRKGQWHDKGTRLCPICGNEIPFGKQCGNCGGR